MANAKRILEAADIRRCFDAYLDVISGIDGVRLTNDMASRVQYPKLPSECTQALLRDLVVAGTVLPELGPINSAAVGTKEADLIVVTDTGRITVEVKATARDYTELSAGDLQADYFIWLDFRAFVDTREVTIYSVRGPVERFGWVRDKSLHMARFLRDTEGQRAVVVLDFVTWPGGAD